MERKSTKRRKTEEYTMSYKVSYPVNEEKTFTVSQVEMMLKMVIKVVRDEENPLPKKFNSPASYIS